MSQQSFPTLRGEASSLLHFPSGFPGAGSPGGGAGGSSIVGSGGEACSAVAGGETTVCMPVGYTGGPDVWHQVYVVPMTSVLATPATIAPAQEHCSSGVGVGWFVGVTLWKNDQLWQ